MGTAGTIVALQYQAYFLTAGSNGSLNRTLYLKRGSLSAIRADAAHIRDGIKHTLHVSKIAREIRWNGHRNLFLKLHRIISYNVGMSDAPEFFLPPTSHEGQEASFAFIGQWLEPGRTSHW
jgi:hypothetical protein